MGVCVRGVEVFCLLGGAEKLVDGVADVDGGGVPAGDLLSRSINSLFSSAIYNLISILSLILTYTLLTLLTALLIFGFCNDLLKSSGVLFNSFYVELGGIASSSAIHKVKLY